MPFLAWFRRNLAKDKCQGFGSEDGAPKPCSGKPDQELSLGAPPSETRQIVTLVHGTFSPHARWMRDGGSLCDQLRAMPNTRLSRFCWSGSNTHSARLKAGKELAIHLRQLIRDFPGARQFVAAHSHGGNVALYAMDDDDSPDGVKLGENECIGGVITLATPFLVLRKRLLPSFVLSSAWIAIVFALFATVLIGLVPSEVGTERATQSSREGTEQRREEREKEIVAWSGTAILVSLSLVWLIASSVSTRMYCRGEFGLRRLFRFLLARRKADQLMDAELDQELNAMLARLRPSGIMSDRLLVVRPLGDEASMGLVVAQFFSWTQNRILRLLQTTHDVFLGRSVPGRTRRGCAKRAGGCLFTVVKLGVIIALALTLNAYFEHAVETIVTLVLNRFGESYHLLVVTILLLFVGLLAFFVLFGFIALIGMIGLLLAALPFGLDAMFWNHFASTTAETSPLGDKPSQIYVAGSRVAAGLAHSGIYEDPLAIEMIVQWIGERRD